MEPTAESLVRARTYGCEAACWSAAEHRLLARIRELVELAELAGVPSGPAGRRVPQQEYEGRSRDRPGE